MDILQKKTVKDLRVILREYKKIHCKPYSRLKKAQMIELIKYHGISEHDIEKTGKIKTQTKPKSKPKPKQKPKSKSKLKSESASELQKEYERLRALSEPKRNITQKLYR